MFPIRYSATKVTRERVTLAFTRIIVGFLALLFWAPVADAAGPVIRIGEHSDRTRLAVEWPVPISAQWNATSVELGLRVSEPLPLEMMNIWPDLDGLIASASMSRDRHSLQIGLKSGISARAMIVDGNILAIDFIRAGTNRHSSATDLKVRVGEHADFVRLVIEPVAPGEGSVSADRNSVRILLPDRLDPGELRKLERFREFISEAHTEGSSLLLRLAGIAPVRSMNVDGDKLVVDIPKTAAHTSAPGHADKAHGTSTNELARPTSSHSATGHKDSKPTSADHGSNGHGANTHGTNSTDTHGTDNHDTDPHAPDVHSQTTHEPEQDNKGHGVASHDDPAQNTATHGDNSHAAATHGDAPHSPVAGTHTDEMTDTHGNTSHDVATHDTGGHETSTHGHQSADDTGHGMSQVDSHEQPAHTPTTSHRTSRPPPMDLAQMDRSRLVRGFNGAVPRFDRLPVVAAPRENGFELRFLWPDEVAAAMFVRAGYLWVAFNATVDQVAADRETMQRYAGAFIRSIRQEAHDEATIFRFALNGRVSPRVSLEGTAWHVIFGNGGQPPGMIEFVRIGPEPGLLLEQAEGAATVTDPIVGDTVGMAFFRHPGTAFGKNSELVNLAFIPAIQGVAWRQKSPDLQTTKYENGVLIDRTQGLNLGSWGGRKSHTPAHSDGAPDSPDHAETDSGHAVDTAHSAAPHGSEHQSHDETASHTVGTPVSGNPAHDTHGGDDHATLDHVTAGSGDAHLNASGHDTTGHSENNHGNNTHGGNAHEGQDSHSMATASDYLQFTPDHLLELAHVNVEIPSTLWQQRQEILPQLSDERPNRRFMAHIALARLHLAHGVGREALSHIERARDMLADIDQDKRDGAVLAMKAIEGVARLQSGYPDAARELLNDEALAGDAEVVLWKTVADIRAGRPTAAKLDEKKLHTVLKSYGAPMQIELGMELVRSYLDKGKADPAFVLLDHLDRLPLTPENEAPFRLVQATAFARDGDKLRALSYLEQAAAAARMPLSLEIEAELNALRLELGEIDNDQAIAVLEKDRFLWRGQAKETELMRRYGKLLADGSRAEEALEIWQEAAEKASSPDESRMISEDMSILFADILAGRDGWKRSPLQALAVYRRYRELLPTGPVGNRLVSQLADEIDGIGLHSVAAAMLDRQTAFRIDDPGKRGTAQLLTARMHLDAGDAEKALAILKSGDLDILGPAEQARRSRLIADALQDLGRRDELDTALANSDEGWAQAIRIEEAYSDGNDKMVEREAREYLAKIGDDSAIEGESAKVLLQLAMVHASRNDRIALADLAKRYAERMNEPEDRAMLALITASPPDQGHSKELIALSGEYVGETRKLLSEVKTR